MRDDLWIQDVFRALTPPTQTPQTAVKRPRGDPGPSGENVEYAEKYPSDQIRERYAPPEIMVYGDSNSWGMSHDATRQIRYRNRWPRLLQKHLDAFYDKKKVDETQRMLVVEDNLCSRTTVHDCTDDEWVKDAEPHVFNGLHHFTTSFSTHTPRWLIINLGTNDLKRDNRTKYVKWSFQRHSDEALKIAKNVVQIAKKALDLWPTTYHSYVNPDNEQPLNILIISPPKMVFIKDENEDMGYDSQSQEISKKFKDHFEMAINSELCGYSPHVHHLPLQDEIQMVGADGSKDGIHVTEEHCQQIAKLVWDKLQTHEPSLKP